MNRGWKARPFEECIDPVAYTTKVQRKDFLAAGAYPIVSQEDEFVNGYWDEPSDVFRVATPVVVFGDHTRTLKFIDFDFVLGADGVRILQPREELLPKFFYYQLRAADLPSLGYSRHYKLLKALEITYPPKPEQQRIVRILDEAFEGVATAKANAESNFRNARAVLESHVQAVFARRGRGWVERTLGDVCILQRGFDLPTRDRIAGPFPLVSSSGVIDTHTMGPVKGPGVATGRSGSIGKVFFLEADFWPLNTVLYVREFQGNDPKFVYRLLRYFELHRFATGSGVPTLNRNFIHGESVWIPESKLTQQSITALIDSLESECRRLANVYERKLAALDTLKKSLLHQAFTGNL